MLHTGATPPYGRMLPSIVPCNPAVDFPTLRAVYNARQGVLAAVNPFLSFLEEQADIPLEYDEQLVRRLVEKVTVYEEELVVEFKSGLEIRAEI